MIDPKLNVSRDLHISNSRLPCAQRCRNNITLDDFLPTFCISVNDPKNVYLSLLSYLRTSPPYRRLRLRSSSRAQKTHFKTEIASKPGKNDYFFFTTKGISKKKSFESFVLFSFYSSSVARSIDGTIYSYHSSLSEKRVSISF